jgi:hypothetical protein
MSLARFPSVLLHPPPLASDFSASYGEMSRRRGFAAKADNHSDISPFDRSTRLTVAPF